MLEFVQITIPRHRIQNSLSLVKNHRVLRPIGCVTCERLRITTMTVLRSQTVNAGWRQARVPPWHVFCRIRLWCTNESSTPRTRPEQAFFSKHAIISICSRCAQYLRCSSNSFRMRKYFAPQPRASVRHNCNPSRVRGELTSSTGFLVATMPSTHRRCLADWQCWVDVDECMAKLVLEGRTARMSSSVVHVNGIVCRKRW